MKKILTLPLLAIAVLSLAYPVVALGVKLDNPIGPNNIGELVEKIADGVAVVIGPLALIMFIVSGILFLASAGSPERVNTAKTCFVYAIIGAAVALAAKGVAEFVGGIFT